MNLLRANDSLSIITCTYDGKEKKNMDLFFLKIMKIQNWWVHSM